MDGVFHNGWVAIGVTAMDTNKFNFSQLNLSVGVRRVAWLLLICWLLSVGGGVLVRSFVFILGLMIVTPIVGFFGLKWWLRVNLVPGACPVCQHEFTALNNQTIACPNCDAPVQIVQKRFQRVAQDGVIDIAAVEVVSTSVIEESELS
jgi:hypothetical protein